MCTCTYNRFFPTHLLSNCWATKSKYFASLEEKTHNLKSKLEYISLTKLYMHMYFILSRKYIEETKIQNHFCKSKIKFQMDSSPQQQTSFCFRTKSKKKVFRKQLTLLKNPTKTIRGRSRAAPDFAEEKLERKFPHNDTFFPSKNHHL